MDFNQCDGAYFTPTEESDELEMSFFITDPEYKGNKVQYTTIGDMYHIAFFKIDENGIPFFDEEFEAIFADPVTYITKSLIGSNFLGCIFRKTDISHKWWSVYLERAKDMCLQLQKGQTPE
jgi:hypothetical protein